MQKGKLEELNLILSGGGMGGLPPFAADFYQDEPWVEFIEVDAEDTDSGEKEDHQGLDTQRLLGLPQPINQPMNVGCANTIRYCTGSCTRNCTVCAFFLHLKYDLTSHLLSSLVASLMMTQAGQVVTTQIFSTKTPQSS